MITKQDYIDISHDPQRDIMPVYYFFFTLRGGDSIPYETFMHAFSLYLLKIVTLSRLPQLQTYVFKELDKHFEV